MAIANLYIVISNLLGATQNFIVLVAIATCNACLVVQYTWLKNKIKEVNSSCLRGIWKNVEECMCYESYSYDYN